MRSTRKLLFGLLLTTSGACDDDPSEPMGVGEDASGDADTTSDSQGPAATSGDQPDPGSDGGTGSSGGDPSTTGNDAEPPELDPALLFFDDLEYAVERETDPETRRGAFAAAGWTGVKSMPEEDGARGYVYTAPSIPGFDGAFPGAESQSVLALEARPAESGFQTDFYLQYGSGDAAAGTLPPDVWFQFWVYPNHTEEQPSQFHRAKFLYVCDGPYPCSSHAWLLETRGCATSPFMENDATPDACPFGEVSDGNFFFNNIASTEGVSTANYSGGAPWNAHKFGAQTLDGYIASNRWTLVKVHMDTSTDQGTFEMWLRHRDASWTKVAEWIGGQTEDFDWTLTSAGQDGHRVLRLPTTVGDGAGTGQNYDYWLYLDDFAIANAESHLPVYTDDPG